MTLAEALLASVGILVVLAPGVAASQTDQPLAIASAAQEVRLDGVLDEPAWARATPIGPLLQRDPKEGAPASEKTEVRVLFDADNLSFGIKCYDRLTDGASPFGHPRRRPTSDWRGLAFLFLSSLPGLQT